MNNISKSILPVIIGLSVTFTTILKCYVICYKRSILEIDDAKLSVYSIGIITFLSVSTNVLKYLGETKPTFQQVSNIALIIIMHPWIQDVSTSILIVHDLIERYRDEIADTRA